MKIRILPAIMSLVLMLALILTACSGDAAPAASTSAETEITSEESETPEADQESTEAAASTEETTAVEETETEKVIQLDPSLDLANCADNRSEYH